MKKLTARQKKHKRERDRCIEIIHREADKLAEEGAPTPAMLLRKVAQKIRRSVK